MKLAFKQKILIVCLSTAFTLSGCNDDDTSTTASSAIASTSQTNNQQNAIGTFVSERPYTLDSLDNAKSMKVMDYTMENVHGNTITTSAFVFFPKTAKPEGGYKVVVWQHGTLGVGNDCAPTVNPMNTRFKNPLAQSLLDAGYVVIAPDYEGLGSTGIHPYLNVDSQSKSTIAAVQAAQIFYADQLSKDWMTVGQSQGGQASLGVAEYITNHPDSGYKGAIAGAPGSSINKEMMDLTTATLSSIEQQEIAAGLSVADRQNGSINVLATLLTYSSFLAVSLKALDPHFDYKTLFTNDRTRNIVALAEGSTGEDGLCLDSNLASEPEKGLRYRFIHDISAFLTENPDKSINDYHVFDSSSFYNNPNIIRAIADAKIGGVKISTPIMIIQGTEDTSIPYSINDALQQKYKELGNDVTFVPAVGATHTQAIVQKNPELLAFIQSKMPAQ